MRFTPSANTTSPRPLACLAVAIHLALGGAVLTTPALAAAAPQTQQYAIPAGPLDEALSLFARQSGVAISLDSNQLRGRVSPGLQGSHSLQAGFVQLLKGSGLQAVESANGYFLAPAPAAHGALELGATQVSGQGLKGQAVTEHTGSYTTGVTQTATKLPLSLRETPQSVTVITRQHMDDRGMKNLEDAIKETPGVTLVKGGTERVELYARGFWIRSLMYDGLPSSYDGDSVPSPDLAMYDRMEVVRGASGLMQGSGTPSAAINLVRKRPTVEPQARLTGTVGRWDNYRSELDLSSALNDSGTLRGRVVGAYQKKQSFQDYTSNEYGLFYAIGEADLSEDTTLTLGFSYQDDINNATWGGIPVERDGSDMHLPRNTYLGYNWEYWDKDATTVFGELEHRFDNGWKLRLAASKSWVDMAYLGSVPANYGTWGHTTGQYASRYDNNSLDLFASGPFQLAGREHELVIGASRREVSYLLNGDQRNVTGLDFATWDRGSLPKPAFNMNAYKTGFDTEQTGTYVTTRLNLADPLKVILGGRLDWYENTTTATVNPDFKVTRNLTRYAGVIYDLDQHHSVYASYTDIFEPQNSRGLDGNPIDPIVGTNYEIGIKGEYFDERLNASAAIFQIDQENRAAPLDNQLGCPGGMTCYGASGKVRSQGVELELNGALTERWQVSAGYTFADARYKHDADKTKEGQRFDSNLPQHQLKLGTVYRLPGDQWRIGANVSRQSKIYGEGTYQAVDYHIEQAAYTLVDAMLGYRISADLDAQLNLNNLLDKRYYQTLASHPAWGGVGQYGAPRNASLTLRYDF